MKTWNSYFNLYPHGESTEKMMLHDPLAQNGTAWAIGTKWCCRSYWYKMMLYVLLVLNDAAGPIGTISIDRLWDTEAYRGVGWDFCGQVVDPTSFQQLS